MTNLHLDLAIIVAMTVKDRTMLPSFTPSEIKKTSAAYQGAGQHLFGIMFYQDISDCVHLAHLIDEVHAVGFCCKNKD